MNNGRLRSVAVTPLTAEQRQRLECMTAIRDFYPNASTHEVIRLTEYLVNGETY
jgi:hypothetical protein